MHRRGFLSAAAGLLLAPAVVKAESLMPIVKPWRFFHSGGYVDADWRTPMLGWSREPSPLRIGRLSQIGGDFGRMDIVTGDLTRPRLPLHVPHIRLTVQGAPLERMPEGIAEAMVRSLKAEAHLTGELVGAAYDRGNWRGSFALGEWRRA